MATRRLIAVVVAALVAANEAPPPGPVHSVEGILSPRCNHTLSQAR